MSYVSYQKCDICGGVISRTWYQLEPNKLFRMFNNHICEQEDICKDCLEKFKKLVQDKKTENDVIAELLNQREFADVGEEYYWAGVDDALACLSHRRMNK